MSIPSAPAITSLRFFQFRLATLLLLTVWIAVVCAALKSSSPPWPAIIDGACLLSILSSATISFFRTGRTRALAIGYLIFSGGFFLYQSFRSPAWLPYYVSLGSIMGQEELTSFSMLLYFMLHEDQVVPSSFPGGSSIQPNLAMFMDIYNHSLATFLGLLGSLLAQYLYATQPRETATASST